MADETPTASADQLIQAARLAGFKVTHDQLRRWHLAGAMPRPTQVSLGRPLGTVSMYPAVARRQLVRLCQLHRQEKRLGHISWALWWEGYSIDTTVARSFLGEVANDLDKTLSKVRWLLADDDAANVLFEKSVTTRISHALVRQVRKRVGSQRFPQVVDLILRVSIGSFTGYAVYSDEQEVFEKGLGIDRARTDRMYLAPPWLQDGEEPLVRLSALLKNASFTSTLDSADDHELEDARGELRRFMTLMDGFGRATGHWFGRGAFGMILFSVGKHLLGIEDYARQCLLWLHTRRSDDMQRGMSTILEAEPLLEGLIQTSDAMDVLAAEVPAFARLVTPSRMRAAARSSKIHEQHMRELREAYEANRDAVEEFKTRHPNLILE